MASKEGSAQPQHFVEEIDYKEIQKIQVVGKGSFGVVWKAKWGDIFVAVKQIDSEAEKKAFAVEVRQLSRISHPNIVKLYGACTQNPVCLVMEYAEGGSLYNVLHCRPSPKYTAGHAMSWALQCANGVAYLHNMKPKALIHRDLKPPNLLLVMGGKVLKICDFGTACDKKTYMTNNKGSAAWMAPEVFKGSTYTEKCDIFSWGVILWEVLSRKRPFDNVGRTAYAIMWAVHLGDRPPLLENCPPLLEKLMTSCWDQEPAKRPSMDEVVRVMNMLFPFFSGHEEELEYSSGDEESVTENNATEDYDSDELDTRAEIDSNIFSETSRTQISTSATMNGSVLSGGSIPPLSTLTPLKIHVEPDAWTLQGGLAESEDSGDECKPWEADPHLGWRGQNGRRPATDPTKVEMQGSAGFDKTVPIHEKQPAGGAPQELDNVYLMLDPQLHPVMPDSGCQESLRIFQQHKQLAQEYLKVQTEIAYLSRHMDQLAERLSEAEGLSQLDQLDSERLEEELRKLENEKENLQALHRNLKKQLELIRRQRNSSVADEGWVVLPHQDRADPR